MDNLLQGRTVIFLESSPAFGGQERQLLQQMKALSGKGYHCLLVCRSGSRIDEEGRRQGEHIVNLSLRNSCHLPSILGIRKLIKRHRPLACISHSGHDANCLSIAALTRWHRPRIIRSRTWHSQRRPSLLSRLLPVDEVMVPSRYLAEQLRLQRPDMNIRVVYPGINFTALDDAKNGAMDADLQVWMATRKPLIVHAAMFRGEKNHRLMLAVIRQLKEKYPEIGYLALGEGKDRAHLLAMATGYSVEQNSKLASVASVAAPMVKADLVVMPSLYEPLGMSQIEALGLGVPVMVSNRGGLPETVRQDISGVVVNDMTEASWVAAVSGALEAGAHMRDMAAVGKKDVRARFSIEENTRQLIAVIHGEPVAKRIG